MKEYEAFLKNLGVTNAIAQDIVEIATVLIVIAIILAKRLENLQSRKLRKYINISANIRLQEPSKTEVTNLLSSLFRGK